MNEKQPNFKEQFKNSIEHELISSHIVKQFEAYYTDWKGHKHEENIR